MESTWPAEAVVLEVARGPLAEPVLARAMGAVAVRCDLPLDRLEDAVLLLGTLLEGTAPDGEPLQVRLEPWERAVAIRAGPYAPGEAERVLGREVLAGGGVVAALAGGAEVAQDDGQGTFIVLVVAAAADGAL